MTRKQKVNILLKSISSPEGEYSQMRMGGKGVFSAKTDGQRWAKRNNGQRWAKSNNGQRWAKSNNGQRWGKIK